MSPLSCTARGVAAAWPVSFGFGGCDPGGRQGSRKITSRHAFCAHDGAKSSIFRGSGEFLLCALRCGLGEKRAEKAGSGEGKTGANPDAEGGKKGGAEEGERDQGRKETGCAADNAEDGRHGFPLLLVGREEGVNRAEMRHG